MNTAEDKPQYYQPVEEDQPLLFDMSDWKREWQDMPEFVQEEVAPYHTVIVRFACAADLEKFSRLVEQRLEKGREAASIWYPKMKAGGNHMDSTRVYADES